jgi:alditol oxidase
VAIHTTWHQEVDTVMNLLPVFEEKLLPFGVAPHWAKLFTLAPSVLEARYERMESFKQLVARHDPLGKFRNEYLETLIG